MLPPAVHYANRVAETMAMRTLVGRLSLENLNLTKELATAQQRLHVVEEKISRLEGINRFILKKFENEKAASSKKKEDAKNQQENKGNDQPGQSEPSTSSTSPSPPSEGLMGDDDDEGGFQDYNMEIEEISRL